MKGRHGGGGRLPAILQPLFSYAHLLYQSWDNGSLDVKSLSQYEVDLMFAFGAGVGKAERVKSYDIDGNEIENDVRRYGGDPRKIFGKGG